MKARSRKLTLCLLLLCAIIASHSSPVLADSPPSDVYNRIKARVDQIRIIDTHEHLSSEEVYLKKKPDFLANQLHYVESDLVSAGLPRGIDSAWQAQVQIESMPFPERWELFRRYWPDARFTGYGRALEIVARDLYGVNLDKLTPELGDELNRRIAESMKPGLYQNILKDKAHIDLSIVDGGNANMDRRFFVRVMRFDDFITSITRKQWDSLGSRTGVKILTLDDLIQALGAAFDTGIKEGIVGVKSGLAYGRRIYYPLPSVDEARAAFDKANAGTAVKLDEALILQNFMMHEVCKQAAKHDLPFQIHTGLQTGFGNRITNSKPTDLVDLIMAHPKVKFVLFHGGYPYGSELATMGKNFANVYIDMCWLHIISPTVARNYLSEWIETVPANKITGFGGDYLYVEGVYAHAAMARQNVARVLAAKVAEGYFSEEDALSLAVKLLRQNAIDLYHLPLN